MHASQRAPRSRRLARLLLSASLLALAACRVGGGGNGDETSADSSTPSDGTSSARLDELRQRVIAWYPIAHSSPNPNTRYVGRDIPQQGWAQFVNDVVIPQTSSRGLHRIMLHNPFGRSPCDISGCEPFQFDQYIEAQNAGLDNLTDTFVDAWKPVTGMGDEVIAYIGSPRFDPESRQIIDQQGEEAFYDWAWTQAIKPITDAGMTIGFDAAVTADQDSATYRFAKLSRSKGMKGYVEAGPRASDDWWFEFPIISRDDTWRNRSSDPAFASREQLQDEIVRIVTARSALLDGLQPGQWPPRACQVIADGDTLAIEDDFLQDPQRDMQSLAECANKL